MGSPTSPKPLHLHYHHRRVSRSSSLSSNCSSGSMGSIKGKGKASLITRITPLIPFSSLLLALLSLHLVSLLQTRLYLVSHLKIHHRNPISQAVVSATSVATAASGSSLPENEWERYWILFEAVRIWLWFNVAGAAAGCYGIFKAAPRALLVSILHSHFTLLLTLSSAIPLLVIAIFPSVFTIVEPLPPLICEEILSHPQALRDVFEPLLLLSPYEDAGCEGWISTFAAPIILVGVIGYGLVHWWMNTRVRGYYGALVRKQARDEARFGPAVNIDEKLALDGDVELPSETRSQPSSPTTSKAKPALALYLGRASLSDILPPSPTIPSPHILYLPIPATHPLHRSAFSNPDKLVMVRGDVTERVTRR